ncbi:hypothetical protein Q765_07420 [Flavobacterium rivuli WB 3.3-2 = DSM 21788]|uniref:Fibronectin type-III domain-containing protein n=1 Tax=Flavobacterium rivuli WB 3.3-2 = DSM 21788 TaxID=1121895 RepID=A0A0A2MFF7_9FLAO|nr:GEVED domain-containing protein [Flavobacterium rivuli]KGO87035.1 hypothetical protein Q765_07420 [Flavobacterium rivuli WB 3.3-2 = DSM 21788]
MKNNYKLLPEGDSSFLPPPGNNGKRLDRMFPTILKNRMFALMACLFMLTGAHVFAQTGETCATAIDLTNLTSPINATTVGAANDVNPSCMGDTSGPDLVYSITVPNGYTIIIGQTVNDNNGQNYDSVHSVSYGTCASQTVIACIDDPDTIIEGPESQVEWENNTGSTQTVYWYQDGLDQNSQGTFTLAWSLLPPPACNVPRTVMATLTTATLATASWVIPNTGTVVNYEYAITNSDVPPASGTITTATTVTGITVAPNQQMYLYVRTNCGVTNGYSEWVVYPFYSGICIPTPEFADEGGIVNVTIGGDINNTTDATNAYYTDYSAQSATIGQGDIRQFSITMNTFSPYNIKMWVDWNNNLAFEDNEEVYSTTSQGTEFSTVRGNLTVPSTAAVGSHRLRIGAVPSWFGQPNACSTEYFGVYEDYTINVTTPPTCFAPLNVAYQNVSLGIVNISWSAPATGTAPAGYQYAIDTNYAPPATGTSVTATSVSGISVISDTEAYLHVRTNCGGSDYSQWNTIPLYNGFCTPAPEYVDGAGITNVTIGTLNNTTDLENSNYGNFTNLVTTVGQGVTQPFSITLNVYDRYHVKVWVDWNDDLDFTDANEEVYSGTSPSRETTTVFGTFLVPVTAALGNHRLRVGVSPNFENNPDSCFGNVTYGAVEDYTINVTTPPSCYTPTNPVGVSVSSGVANISWTAPTLGGTPAGYEYAVTSTATPPATGTVTTATSVANVAVTANAVSYIHVRTNCGSGSYSQWFTATYYNGHCQPHANYVDGRGITNVILGTINNTTEDETDNYGDYSAQAVTVGQGDTQPIRVTLSLNASYTFKVWIDWNNDLDFDDEGEEVLQTESENVAHAVITGTINIPLTAPLGSHRLRIGGVPGFEESPISPCFDDYYGTFEDYTITITAPPACFKPLNFEAESSGTGLATLTWAAPASGTPTGYEYAVTSTFTAPAAGTATTTTTVTNVAVTPNVTVYLHVRTSCGGSFSAWTTIPFYNGVCVPNNNYVDGDGITGFYTGSISNSTEEEEGNYGDYSAQVVNIGQGVVQPFRLALSTNVAYHVIIWADWNNDQVFDDSEAIYTGLSENSALSIIRSNFTIPLNAALGNHRIRIGISPIFSDPPTPCSVDFAGAYEDYTINVTTPPTCYIPVNPIGVATASGIANLSWSVPSQGGTPVGYEYAVDTNNSTVPATGTAVTGTTVTGYTGFTDNVYYYLHVRANCGGGDFSEWITSEPFRYLQGDTCESAIDLSTLISPYTFNTTGADDNYEVPCDSFGTAPDLFYSIQVPAGYTLDIGLTNTEYFSVYSLFYGSCTSQTLIACNTDASVPATWENLTDTTQTVYWVQDGFGQNDGEFTLEWSLTPPPACNKPRNLAAVLASLTTTNISWSAPNTGTPVGYEYAITQSATPPTSGTFTSSTSVPNVTVTPNVDLYLHVRTVCNDADGNSIWVSYLFFNGYCVPRNIESTSYYITGVSTTGGTTNFSSTSTSFSAFTDYTATHSVSTYPGGSFRIQATTPNTTDQYIYTVWIDWNNDFDFDDTGERMINTGYLRSPVAVGTVTVPVTAALGNYRVRIRNARFGAPVPACGEQGSGEAEDYTLQVVAAPSCFPPYNLSITPTDPGYANLNWSVPSLGGIPTGYEYVLSTSSTPPTGNGTPSPTFFVGDVAYDTTQSAYLFVRSNCGGGDYSTWATVPLLGTDSPDFLANSVIVYKEGSAINITSGSTLIKGVTIYDTRGRKLYSQADINNTEVALTGLQIQQQVVIVEINTTRGKVSKRIVF